MWKKALKVYNMAANQLSAALSPFTNAHCRKRQLRGFTAGGLLLLNAILFAEVRTEEKSGSLTMPSMPSSPAVSMPSVGSGFYAPGRSDFYNPNLQRKKQAPTAQTTDSKSVTQNSSASSASDSSTQNQNATLNQTKKLNTLAKSASSSLNQLTADDISSMNNLGVLGSLSGLLGRGNSNLQSQLLSNQNMVSANTVDSATLQQILGELTELKNKVASGTSVSERNAGENTFSNIVKKEPKILRFVVNGYDILPTCKKIYFSEEEADGTFLLTGDRKYMSENKVRSETFYFYFHAKGTENGVTKYTITPAVSQDYENQYSYLYQLTKKNALSADRTGNLVTLRVGEGAWTMDLLLSMDK